MSRDAGQARSLAGRLAGRWREMSDDLTPGFFRPPSQPDPSDGLDLEALRALATRLPDVAAPKRRAVRTPSRGRPVSRPPAGVDTLYRAALVTAARCVADAHRHFADFDPPVRCWFPSGLGHRFQPRGDRLVVLRPDPDRLVVAPRVVPYPVRWTPDPSDQVLVLPGGREFTAACERLSGLAGWAATGRVPLGPVVGALRRAHATLDGVAREPTRGEWAALRRPRCAERWCRQARHHRQTGLCQEHYDAWRRAG